MSRQHHDKFGMILLAAGIMLAACGRDSPAPTYKQSEFAKNPDGDCVRTPAGFYADKAKTPQGIEEVIFIACQSGVRGDYHGSLATEGAGIEQRRVHLDIALRCQGEAIDAMKALQVVGVTDYRCPGGPPK